MESITKLLFELRDEEYAKFQAKLTPSVDPKLFIGVRVPDVRKLAKELKNDPGVEVFLQELPHKYYDENMLHGLLISEIKDFDIAIKETDRFLPYVDNWAVCDIMSPMIFKRKSFHLFRNVGNDKIANDELIEIEKAYAGFDALYPDIKTAIRILPADKVNFKRDAEYCILIYSEKKDNYLMNAGYKQSLSPRVCSSLACGISEETITRWSLFGIILKV